MPNEIAKIAREIAFFCDTRDAKVFLESLMSNDDMPVHMRKDAAIALMPFQHHKLHAIYSTNSTEKTFEQWLDELEAPAKRLLLEHDDDEPE